MAAPSLFFRTLPLLRLSFLQHRQFTRRPFCNAAGDPNFNLKTPPSLSQFFPSKSTEEEEQPSFPKLDDPEFRKWKIKEAEIFEDIESTICFTKEILHSNRYLDGERLNPDDEKIVVDKLLMYHPHSEDKIGCGLDSIMVDRHPIYKHSRCLFVVRSDGGWIDFSYQKCLRAYIRDKYHSYAERFIKEHFKRGRG